MILALIKTYLILVSNGRVDKKLALCDGQVCTLHRKGRTRGRVRSLTEYKLFNLPNTHKHSTHENKK